MCMYVCVIVCVWVWWNGFFFDSVFVSFPYYPLLNGFRWFLAVCRSRDSINKNLPTSSLSQHESSVRASAIISHSVLSSYLAACVYIASMTHIMYPKNNGILSDCEKGWCRSTKAIKSTTIWKRCIRFSSCWHDALTRSEWLQIKVLWSFFSSSSSYVVPRSFVEREKR